MWIYVCLCLCLGAQSCPTLCDLWTVAHQGPPSMGFSRQEYWSGLPFPSPGDLPNPGIEPRSHIAGRRFNLCATREALGSQIVGHNWSSLAYTNRERLGSKEKIKEKCLRYTRYRGMAFFVWGHILLDKGKSYSPKLTAREDGKSNLPLYFRRENGIRGLWVSLCWIVVKNVWGSQMTWVRILVFLFLVELIMQTLKTLQVAMKIKCINSCKILQKHFARVSTVLTDLCTPWSCRVNF